MEVESSLDLTGRIMVWIVRARVLFAVRYIMPVLLIIRPSLLDVVRGCSSWNIGLMYHYLA